MSFLYRTARRLKDSVSALLWLHSKAKQTDVVPTCDGESAYQARLAAETRIYKDVEDINILPQIFHYWSNTYIRPMLEEYGCSNPDQFFAKYLRESAERCADGAPFFISIGAGNCDTEIRVAQLMRNAGLSDLHRVPGHEPAHAPARS